MSDELKNCPFCGQPAEYLSFEIMGEQRNVANCVNIECWLHHRTTTPAGWNIRPIEDALTDALGHARFDGSDELKDTYQNWLDATKEIEQLRNSLSEIRRILLAPETKPDRPYSLIANIDHLAAIALGEKSWGDENE